MWIYKYKFKNLKGEIAPMAFNYRTKAKEILNQYFMRAYGYPNDKITFLKCLKDK